MRGPRWGWLVVGCLAWTGCDDPGADAPDASPQLPPRPAVQTCRPAALDPHRLPDLVARPALEGVVVPGARALVESARGDAWLVANGEQVIRVPVGPGAGAPMPWLRLPWRRIEDLALSPTGRHAFVVTTGASGTQASRFPIDPTAPELDPRQERVLATWAGPVGSLAFDEEGGLFVAGDEIWYLPDPEGELPSLMPFARGVEAPAQCSADGAELWCLSGDGLHRLSSGDVAGPTTRVLDIAPAACAPAAGHVYRGIHWPELVGTYVFAQGCDGEVVGVRATPEGPLRRTLGHLGTSVQILAQDGQGRLLALDDAGRAHRLEVADPDTHLGWPDRLSETGCFSALQPLTPGPDLVPYELNAPLWTDGAEKTRFLVLPPDTQITPSDAGEWSLPEGTVLIKHFAFVGTGGQLMGVETRFMVLQPFGWSFHTYRWDEAGQEAWLLDGLDEEERTLPLPEGGDLSYFFPSRFDCHTCHQRRAEMVLGPRTAQLDRRTARGGDQLDIFVEAGLLTHRPTSTVLPSPEDPNVPLAERARAWLHANCAHCHQPGGWTPPDLDLDLRFDTPLPATGLCAPAKYPVFGLGESRIVPGRPSDSNLYQRLVTEGFGRMPLIGTRRTDPLVEVVIRPWITEASGCR